MQQRFPILVLLLALCVPSVALCAFAKNAPGLFVDDPNAIPVSDAKKQKTGKDEPVVLSADEMGYDQENGIVIARGKVEAVQGSQVVLADQMTYFQRTDKLVAEGNVSMLQPSGDVLFAEKAVLTDEMKKGVISAFQARLADNSVFVAKKAEKVSPSLTTMQNAQYTPCNICQGMAPFWQLNGKDVKIDEISERVSYNDATMDVLGVPVFYTPYLSHPTPDSSAKSGFLSPQYANNGSLGTVIRTPFYWRIDNDKDALITPWYTAQDGVMMQGDYRQLTNNGTYHFQGAITDPQKLDLAGNPESGHELRGYLFGQGKENIAEDTDIGFDLQRTTDQTFLRRYNLSAEPTLFSRLFAEAAEDRNFGQIQAMAIQGLRLTDEPANTPLILPSVQAYYETQPDEHGIRYHLSENAQSLTRDIGVDQSRISMTAGASMPYVTDSGQVLTTTVNLRQDAYDSAHVPVPGTADEVSGDTFRTVPQGALEWRYPLINPMANGSVTVEPIVMTVVQPSGQNPVSISNEDSRLLELTDTNIFSIDRMPGVDLVDSGSRVAYGARTQYLFTDGTSVDALLGQSYELAGTSPFPTSQSGNDDFSDYIGRLSYNIAPLTLSYRFALDHDDMHLNRNEVAVNFIRPWLTVNTSYRSLDKNAYIATDSKEGQIDASLPFTENWSIHAGARRDFDLNEWVTQNSGLIYKNECFNVMFDVARSFASDRDVTPSTEYLVRVGFKNLGEFGGR